MNANRIRELRKARGIRPEHLAARVGRSATALHQYEAGTTAPPLPVARQIAAVLGVPLDEVFPQGAATDGDSDLLPAA